jgi:signal transduction histidine kinase
MKMTCIILLLLLLAPRIVPGQTTRIDSLKRLLLLTQQDTSRILLLVEIASDYRFSNPDSSLLFAQHATASSQKLNFNKGKMQAFNIIGEARRFRGEFPQALEAQFNSLQISKNISNKEGEAGSIGSIGMVYLDLNDYRQALYYFYQAKKINESVNDVNGVLWLSGIGYAYEKLNMLDSSLYFQQKAHDLLKFFPTKQVASLVWTRLGGIYLRSGYLDKALQYFKESIRITFFNNDILNRGRTQYLIAELFDTENKQDSSIKYALLAFAGGEKISQKTIVLNASSLLARLYKAKNIVDSAYHYQQVAMDTKELMYGQEKFKQLQLLTFSQQLHEQQLREKQVQLQRIILISALAVFLIIAIVLWRNIRFQKRTNQMLNSKNEQIEIQRNTLEKTLVALKGTQAQLIQSEKMASLGELTAGIAHEIQNPLNFVNNFSEVNKELVDELQDELKLGNTEEAFSICKEIKENEQKINQHGKRADAIVKGMLQHSTASTGIKEPTNINALADEYLRLSYHGLRAKDKDFNANFTTDFDESIGNVEVVAADIGRVLLNLYNNAFYSVNEKKKALKGEKYEPIVWTTTKRISTPSGAGRLEISIKDNGTGIPQKALDKIYQPFFTTKPTGQGTGLGLSLSYDIIKVHGGELRVETKEGEGAEFTIQLPVV